MKRNAKSVLSAFLKANEHRWSKKIILQDFIELRREAAHLRAKQGERELTSWENKRIEECDSELSDIFARCLRAGITRENLDQIDSGSFNIINLDTSGASVGEALQQEPVLATGTK
jgi:hypothetical protein